MSLRVPIIIDFGSSEVKAGYRTDNFAPSLRFPSYIGEPKYNKILRSLNKNKSQNKEIFVGSDCDPYLGVVKLRYPIKHGAFENEKDISLIFNHIFSKLKLSPERVSQHPLLISEPILNQKRNREMISSILFEKYNVPSLIFAYQPSLSLLSFSSTTGIMLDSGEGVTQICSICDGYSIPSSFIRSDFGGEDISYYLRKLLKMKGIDLISDTEKLISNEIKKKIACFGLEGKKEEHQATKFTLPDSNVIQIESERFLAPKVLLNPALVGKSCLGLPQMVVACIEKINFELREKLLLKDNIKFTGGNSNIKGLNEVLHAEIRNLLPKYNTRIKIKSIANNSQISCWLGGAIISSLSIFKDLLITKKIWEEKGNEIIHKQTF